MAVFGAPGFDYFDETIIPHERKFHVIDRITDANLLEKSFRVIGEGGRLFEHPVYLVQKTD